MTRYKEWPDADFSLLVGGTPCQSFSIAGLRGGLADPRGNLALVYLAIADRCRPRWLVWENLPGVLSSNGGRDYGALIGAMVQLGYGACWRVLDAQYVRVDGLSLSDEGVCSLSDISETGDVPQRYFLSPKACAGILRRAASRGKELPQHLARALQAAASEPISIATAA